MAKLFRIVLTTILLALAAPLFLPQATTIAYADTWEYVSGIAAEATRDIMIKADAERKQFERQIEQRRGEILQKFNFHIGNATTAIKSCDRAFYESSKSAAFKFRLRKRAETKSQLELSAREIEEKKMQASALEEKFNKYFKQLDSLTALERLTTGRHKKLLGLTTAALIETEQADERLETTIFKNKQLDNLLWFFIRHGWDFPAYPEDCTTESYKKPVAQQREPLDADRNGPQDTDKHASVDDALMRAENIEKRTARREETKTARRQDDEEISKSGGDEHTLFDYCTISAHPNFQSFCYDTWRRHCRDIADPKKQKRCNDALQPGGPRSAGGRIWDFCAFMEHPRARTFCYDGIRRMVPSFCGTIGSMSGGVRDCMKRAASLPSNLPAPERAAIKTAPETTKEAKSPDPSSASSTDIDIGITTTSVRNPDGTRTITKTDKDGKVLSVETVGKSPASASSTDMNTGVTTTSVANPDGTRTVTRTDSKGEILSRETVR